MGSIIPLKNNFIMMKREFILFGIIIVILSSCNSGSKLKVGIDYRISAAGDTILMERNQDGTLIEEYTIVNGKKNGQGWVYYPDGIVKVESNYKNGEQHGITRWFYRNGNVYEYARYKAGKRHGIMRRFDEKGSLVAEIPYKHGELVPGTREFSKTGEIIQDYPSVRFFLDTTRQHEGVFILKMLRTDKEKDIAFHYYKVENGDSLRIGIPVRRHNGIGYMIYNTYSKDNIPDEVSVVGTFTSERGNPVAITGTWRKSDPVEVDPNPFGKNLIRL